VKRLSGRARAVLARRRRPLPPTPADPGFDFRAPACPDDMVAAAPDFVGIGAPRSGTSWWFSLLQRHPDIYDGSGYKELHYLSTFLTGEPSPEDVATYAAWFPRPPGAIAGEWTPSYMAHCWLGPMLGRMAPAAKVVVMLRDPVDRYCSGIRRQLPPQGVHHAVEAANLFHGLYAEHLGRLDPHVADDALLVLQYEQCVRDPQAELARTFRFLGVEPFAVADAAVGDFGTAASRNKESFELSDERRAILVATYRPDVEQLVARHPELDVALWENFGRV
jgi:hypothetical protein